MNSIAPIIDAVPMTPPASNPIDPPAELVALQRDGHAIVEVSTPNDAHLYITLGRQMTEGVLADPRFSANIRRPGFHTAGQVGGMVDVFANSIVRLDDPDHARVRNRVMGEFRPRKLAELTPDIAAIIDECRADLKAAGSGADVVELYTSEIPSRVISRLLGVREENRLRMKELAGLVNEPGASDLPPNETPLEVMGRELADLFDADGFDDGMLKNLAAYAESGEISRAELISMSVLLNFAGIETTANSIALGTALVISNPAIIEEVRADNDLFAPLAEEILRLTTVTRSGPRRFVLEDVELFGHRFRAGDTVILGNQTANRDPAVFGANSDGFDLHRPKEHKVITFGAGMHMCMGQFLARTEVVAALKGLVLGFNDLALPTAIPDLTYKGKDSIYAVTALPITWSSTNF